MSTAIFYASSTGNTSSVAQMISKELGGIQTIDIGSKGISLIEDYDKVILGVSTWGEGELQDDWEELWDDFCALNFEGKTVALFGLGDQEGYADDFVDAMGIVYNQVLQNGAKVIGSWSTDAYDFTHSNAVNEDGLFVGLAIDEDNQDDLTKQRIQQWCEMIKWEIL